ncbi:unnamed protein product [Effrenium voratum]|nr:unnamed protein product [Effrenium voratum]
MDSELLSALIRRKELAEAQGSVFEGLPSASAADVAWDQHHASQFTPRGQNRMPDVGRLAAAQVSLALREREAGRDEESTGTITPPEEKPPPGKAGQLTTVLTPTAQQEPTEAVNTSSMEKTLSVPSRMPSITVPTSHLTAASSPVDIPLPTQMPTTPPPPAAEEEMIVPRSSAGLPSSAAPASPSDGLPSPFVPSPDLEVEPPDEPEDALGKLLEGGLFSNTKLQKWQANPAPAQPSIFCKPAVNRCDLEQRVARLGVGGFGLVTLEADRAGNLYALKAVSKGLLAACQLEGQALREKRVMKMLRTPFVVRLIGTFNMQEHVGYLLEACLGGELFATYERLKLYGNEVCARFYLACATEALDHMHGMNILYRDLKMENLLLDSKGYCKVADFGVAKCSSGRTFTVAGTPVYMAPEVFGGQTGYTKLCDWWSLGVLLFELLSGVTPFDNGEGCLHETERLVKQGVSDFPAMSAEAQNCISQLCRQVPEDRLRVPELRRHGFFQLQQFDWQGLKELRIEPPFVPQAMDGLANFRRCDEEPDAMPYQVTNAALEMGFEFFEWDVDVDPCDLAAFFIESLRGGATSITASSWQL